MSTLANRKVKINKLVGAQVLTLVPYTTADNVDYSDTYTVKDVLDAIVAEIQRLEDLLSIDSLYIRDSNGNIIYESGTTDPLVAVASLIGNDEGNS